MGFFKTLLHLVLYSHLSLFSILPSIKAKICSKVAACLSIAYFMYRFFPEPSNVIVLLVIAAVLMAAVCLAMIFLPRVDYAGRYMISSYSLICGFHLFTTEVLTVFFPELSISTVVRIILYLCLMYFALVFLSDEYKEKTISGSFLNTLDRVIGSAINAATFVLALRYLFPLFETTWIFLLTLAAAGVLMYFVDLRFYPHKLTRFMEELKAVDVESKPLPGSRFIKGAGRVVGGVFRFAGKTTLGVIRLVPVVGKFVGDVTDILIPEYSDYIPPNDNDFYSPENFYKREQERWIREENGEY